MSKPVPEHHKQLARHLEQAFGGDYDVREYLHDTEALQLDLLNCDGRPAPGISSYSTIGLSDLIIPWGDGEFPTRLELAGACSTSAKQFPNVLASAAFNMMRNGKLYHPGAAIEGYVQMYFPQSPLPHLYFTSPFLWHGLTAFQLGDRRITWLQVVPISEAELRVLRERGEQALEDLFETRRIDVHDLQRASAV